MQARPPVLASLVAMALLLAACRGSDVIPFNATKQLHAFSPALVEGDTVSFAVINRSEYQLSELTVELIHRPPESGRSRITTFVVPVNLAPGRIASLRLRFAGRPYETWEFQPGVYRDRGRDENTDFIMGTNHPDWSVAINVVRGHRPSALWGDNYLRSFVFRRARRTWVCGAVA